MRILIVGATGFIGRHLVRSAMAAGLETHAVARRADHGLPCTTRVVAAPFEAKAYGAAIRENGIDAVVNLLAAGVQPRDRDEHQLLEANAVFPPRLAMAAAAAGASIFVQIGSSAEYAALPENRPLLETDGLEAVRLYGATKAAGSLLVQSVARSLGLTAAVMRPFNIFGPGEKPHRLFPGVVRRLAAGEAVDLSGGTQVRDFLSVADACNAILRLVEALADHPDASGIYNLASGVPVSVRDFVETLATLLHAGPDQLRFGALPLRADDLPYVVASVDRLQAVIGPVQRLDLAEAMAQAIRELDVGSIANG